MNGEQAIPKKALWAGRILSGFIKIFFLADGPSKLFKPPALLQATVPQLGRGLFNIAFGFLFGVMVWLGMWLRDARFRTLVRWA